MRRLPKLTSCIAARAMRSKPYLPAFEFESEEQNAVPELPLSMLTSALIIAAAIDYAVGLANTYFTQRTRVKLRVPLPFF